MKQLKFYTKTIDSNLLNCITGLNGKLISLVKSNKFDEDEKALSSKFAGDKGHQYYLNSKQRVLKILHALYLVNPPANRKLVSNERWDCRRKYIAAIGLIESGNRDLAWKPLIQTYRIAAESDYSEMAYGCAVQLMTSASLKRSEKEFNYYSEQAEKYSKDMQAEFKVRQLLYKYGLHLHNSQAVPTISVSKELDALAKYKCESLFFIQTYYHLRILIDIKAGKYALAKQAALAAINQLENNRGVTYGTLRGFYRKLALTQMSLKEYKEANKSLKKAEDYAVEKSMNWHLVQYTKALNYLHQKNYKKAHELYREHRKNKFEVISEYWLIMGGYLYFLREIGAFNAPFERFKVGKYLNDTAPNHHDKKGSNVNVIIGELLIYMVTNRSQFIERVQSINQYSYRYLNDDQSKRAKWFLRLLCKVPAADFNFPKLLKKADSFIDKLNANPIGLGDNLQLEIIPYDHIIELMKNSKVLQKITS